jgi:hypothetical protein
MNLLFGGLYCCIDIPKFSFCLLYQILKSRLTKWRPLVLPRTSCLFPLFFCKFLAYAFFSVPYTSIFVTLSLFSLLLLLFVALFTSMSIQHLASYTFWYYATLLSFRRYILPPCLPKCERSKSKSLYDEQVVTSSWCRTPYLDSRSSFYF